MTLMRDISPKVYRIKRLKRRYGVIPDTLKIRFVWVRSSMVEQTAVNRSVVGSSPTVPAKGLRPSIASPPY